MRFSSSPSGKQTKQMRTPTAQKVFEVIRTGAPGSVSELVENLRKIPDKDAARDYKWHNFPVFIPGGVFTERNVEGLVEHSGCVVIDYDDTADATTLRTHLTDIPHTLAAFISPSGTGVKALVRVEPVPTDGLSHYEAFDAALQAYTERLPDWADSIDAAGRDVCRLCFYSHDPDIFVNWKATPITWTPNDILAKKQDAPEDASQEDASQEPSSDEETEDAAKADDKLTLEAFLQNHDVKIYERSTDRQRNFAKFGKGTRYRIDCAFNPKHKNDAWAFEPDNGPWVYGCSHNSCSGYGWEDFRRALNGKTAEQAKAQSKSKAQKLRPEFYNERGTFLPIVMSDHLLNSKPALTLATDGRVRFYDNGVFRIDTEMALEKAVIDELGKDYQPTDGEKTRKVIATQTMMPMPPFGEQPCQHPWHLNLQNGILDIRTGELTEHSPEDPWIHQLPIRYDTDATCPVFNAWLQETQEGRLQDIALIHELIGVCMLQKVIAPHIYILLGPTHTGKSTMLDVITACLGVEHCQNVAFHELGSKDDKFAAAQLTGMLANLDRDVTFSKVDDVGRLKKIATGEFISVQHKGQNRFSLKPFATLVCATNDTIRSADWTDGWYSRLIVLDFKAQHLIAPKRNQVECMTTDEELSGILNHALAGIQRVLETGKHTESESVANNRRRFEEDDNHIFRWFDESFTYRADEYIPCADVEAHYDAWCKSENLKPSTRKRLRATLGQYGITRHRNNTRNDREWKYRNIAELENAPEPEPTQNATAIDVPF